MTLDSLMVEQRLLEMGNTSEFPPLWLDNNTDPLMRIVQAINLYLIPVISAVGLCGGVSSCLVFTCSTFRYQPCSQYLAMLTLSDTGFLVALLVAWLTTLQPALASTPGYCQVMVYMTYTCSFLSAWYLVLLMLERYVTVCYPLHAPVLCTRQHARVAISLLTLLALLLYLHAFFTTSLSPSSVLESPCQQKEHYLQFLAVFTYLDFFVSFALPFTLVLALNLRIIFAVRNFRRRHQPLRPVATTGADVSGGGGGDRGLDAEEGGRNAWGLGGGVVQYGLMSQAQVRATQLLVWVASVFLVLYLPSHALRIYLLIRVLTEGRVFSERLMLAQQICQFIYYINFAVDFFVFSVSSKSFRRNIARCLKRL